MLAGSARIGLAVAPRSAISSGVHRSAAFSTTCCQAAQQRNAGRDSRKGDSDRSAYDISGIQRFQFDDTTSYGHMILEKKREKLELFQAIERDRSLLEREYRCLYARPLHCGYSCPFQAVHSKTLPSMLTSRLSDRTTHAVPTTIARPVLAFLDYDRSRPLARRISSSNSTYP